MKYWKRILTLWMAILLLTTPLPVLASNQVTVVAVGDDLIHQEIYEAARRKNGTYNFSSLFSHMKSDIQAADLAVINQETILTDGNYSGYPCFGSPKSLGDAIAKAGFDVVLHATNHTMDKGESGIRTTLNFWSKKYPSIKVLGIHKNQKDADKITVVKKNGIRIAMLNYTYGLNGFSLPYGKDYLVDLLDSRTKIQKDIRKARKKSDFVIVFAHWGTEYTYSPDASQKSWAQFFADEGVDVVVGGHPHVLEPVKKIKGKNGNKTLVYYSLGNYVSRQRRVECLLGGMAKFTIVKTKNGARLKSYSLVPLVTHFTAGYRNFTVYKLSDYKNTLAQKHLIRKLLPNSTFTVKSLNALYRRIMKTPV